VIRAILGVLVILISVSVSGCETFEASGSKGQELTLDNDQAYLLQTWYHNAVLSEDVGDYNTAIIYYEKVVEHFPETKKAAMAKKRLKVLNKAH
jgi:outer membrane protein assembly factor BamD (BamD/ComL family)